MKKILLLLSALCLSLSVFSITACGRGYAKIVGIATGIGTTKENIFGYDNPLRDGETLTENDYLLQAGESYIFAVTYTARGGSRYPVVNAENVSFKYDAEALEIIQTSENLGSEIYYSLICKKSVAYTAVMVEVGGEYFDTVVICAE